MKQLLTAIMLFIFIFGFGSSRAFAIIEIQKSCNDFDTWKEAQEYFEANGGQPGLNIDDLDTDGDGIVCTEKPGYDRQTWEDLHPADTDEGNDEGIDEGNDEGIDEGNDEGNDEGIDEENDGGQLPETATNHLNGIIGGVAITVLGSLFFRRKKIMK